jgi:hypothetical protein
VRYEKRHFDKFEPSWNCEVKERVPTIGSDGPKWVCGVDALNRNSLVYAFGSDGECSFENAIRKRVGTTNIYIFDSTLSPEQTARVTPFNFSVIPFGLIGKGKSSFMLNGRTYAARDLISHMTALGHRFLPINCLLSCEVIHVYSSV